MEKNKDKSHLIDQLYDYLEEQIQELKTDRNQLNHKMQDMIQEKNEKEGAINNQQKIYQIRKVFSPLPLEIEEEKQPVSEDMIQIEKEIHEFQMILREKEEKIINYMITRRDWKRLAFLQKNLWKGKIRKYCLFQHLNS